MTAPWESAFVAQSYTKREAWLLGGFLMLVGLACFALEIFDPHDAGSRVATLLTGAAFIAFGVHVVTRGSKQHTVVMNQDGIRIGDEPLVPWSEIDAMRARHRGIDLLSGGRRVGTLPLGLDDPVLAAGLVMKHMRRAPTGQRSVSGRFLLATSVLGLLAGSGLVAGGVWLFLRRAPVLGVCAAIVGLLLVRYSLRVIRRIDFEDGGLRLHRLFGTQFIPRGEIERMDVILNLGAVYAIAFLTGNRHVELQVPGVDPFVIDSIARDIESPADRPC